MSEPGKSAALSPLSLYIHFPWCIRKCPYCDFNSHEAKSGIPEQRYIDALLTDLCQQLSLLVVPRPIQSIFMGGGTPSLFAAESLDRLLREIRQLLVLTDDCEITLEANPGSFESEKFREFRALGINRLSIGIQSFNDAHLKKLGRVHNSHEAISAVAIARAAGFTNINLDLMFGLPEQTEIEALQDVQAAIDLQPQHISFYQLTLEPNTYFHKYPPRLPEDDLIYSLQKAGQQLLAAHGYQQYEISAYAQTDFQCRHNRHYWQFGDYLGIGAGAHGKISLAIPNNIIRTIKPKHPDLYMQQPDHTQLQAIALAQLPLEFMMNHLRLVEGFSVPAYQQLTGLQKTSLEPGLSECLQQNLLYEYQQTIACSAQGWDFLDLILEKFVD